MKSIFLCIVFFSSPLFLTAQSKKEKIAIIGHQKPDSVVRDPNPLVKWISKKVKIGQSMETSDQRTEPAQFQLTVPKKDTTSYLINVGVSVNLDFIKPISSNQYSSKLKVEYHKNTLTAKKQDNFEIGYQGTWNFASTTNDNTLFFLLFDPKYNYDRMTYTNSVASNLLFSWLTENSKLNFNTNNYQFGNRLSEFHSLFAGAQLQQVIKTKAGTGTGLILRPLYTASASVALNRKNDTYKPLIKLTTTYTRRWDIINQTLEDKKKGKHTQLLKCGLDWYVVNDPLEVSLGASYNSGSDPLKGLADQRYWLFTINISL